MLLGNCIGSFDNNDIGGIDAGVLNEMNFTLIRLALRTSFFSTSSYISSLVDIVLTLILFPMFYKALSFSKLVTSCIFDLDCSSWPKIVS